MKSLQFNFTTLRHLVGYGLGSSYFSSGLGVEELFEGVKSAGPQSCGGTEGGDQQSWKFREIKYTSIEFHKMLTLCTSLSFSFVAIERFLEMLSVLVIIIFGVFN